MKSSQGRHGGNQGRNDRNEAEQARGHKMANSLSVARDRDEVEGHTSGKA
ncbi:MAG: hypothetical protein LOX97_11800 [Sphingomonas sp.]|nr:hypothetical protein [Sphingomonas sp.]